MVVLEPIKRWELYFWNPSVYVLKLVATSISFIADSWARQPKIAFQIIYSISGTSSVQSF